MHSRSRADVPCPPPSRALTLALIFVLALGALPAQIVVRPAAPPAPPAPSRLADGESTPKTAVFVVDGQEVRIVSEGGEVEVTVDGEPIAPGRLARRGNTWTVKDDDGTPVATVVVGPRTLNLSRLGREHRVHVGLTLRPLPAALAEHLDLDADACSLVAAVREDGPAAKAGLREYDVLVALGGERPATRSRLREMLAQRAPEDEIEVTYVRRGERRTATITLERSPESVWRAAAGLPSTGRLFVGDVGSGFGGPGSWTIEAPDAPEAPSAPPSPSAPDFPRLPDRGVVKIGGKAFPYVTPGSGGVFGISGGSSPKGLQRQVERLQEEVDRLRAQVDRLVELLSADAGAAQAPKSDKAPIH